MLVGGTILSPTIKFYDMKNPTFGLFTILFLGFAVNVAAQGTVINDSQAPTTRMERISIPDRAEDISPLLIGEEIPDMGLTDINGNAFDLKKTIAQKPTVLVFYRGGWCPYCSLQLSGLQKVIGDLEKLGYQLLAVSTDSPSELKESIGKEKLTYTLISDADLNLSKAMGIAFKAPEQYARTLEKSSGGKNSDYLLPVPSVFILDRKGRIQFEYISPDFKHRLNEVILLKVAEVLLNNN